MAQSILCKFAIISSMALCPVRAQTDGTCPAGGCTAAPESFRYLRLNVRSSNGAHIWCFQEIKFFGEKGVLQLAGKTSASSTYFDIGCGTDKQTGTGGCHYCSSPKSQEYPQWWEYDFGKPVQIGSYELQALTEFDAIYMPRTWTLEGSSDRMAWTVLHKEADYRTEAWGARGSAHKFDSLLPQQATEKCAFSQQLDGLAPKSAQSEWNLGPGWEGGVSCVESECNVVDKVSWCTRKNSGYVTHVHKRSDWGYCRPCGAAAKKEPYTFVEHAGKQCAGTDGDMLRDYLGSPDQCKRKCYDLGTTCAGFIRFETGGNAGKCFFRRGGLRDPFPHNDPPRTCYERIFK